MINWTNVLEALIAGLPAIIAALASAIYAGKIHKQIKTPSGKSIGEVTEYTHDTAIANNMLLSVSNGDTKQADHQTLHDEGTTPPQIPAGKP